MSALPEPLAQGDLARTPFAHLLLTLRNKQLTGSLVVWNPEGEEGRQQDRIRFERGQPASGRLLERASRLDRGMLPLFARPHGPFAFYEGVDLVGTSDQVRTGCIDVVALIAASLRGSSRDDAVNHVIAGLGGARLRFVPRADLDQFELLPDERTCLEILRAEPVDVRRLAELSPLDETTVRRLVYLCILTKQLEPWEGSVDATPSTPRAAAPSAPREPAPEPQRPKAKKRDKATGAPEPPPPAPDRLSDKHRALWEEIRERAAAIETQNYYDMLGVPRDAKATSIETAYYGQVKKWHPDRLPAELVELRGHVDRIFQYLTRAQETLCDDAKRAEYLTTVQEGGGTPEKERELGQIIQAAMEFRKVEVLMRRKDWQKALDLLDEIIAISPDDGQYFATRAEIRRNIDPDDRASVMADLQRALAIADDLDVAHHTMGLMLKQSGDHAKALEHFEKAAKLNPRNIDAAREVRLAQMRGTLTPEKDEKKKGGGKSGGKDAGGSLLGKLFGSGKKK